jgi:hypothetical protein
MARRRLEDSALNRFQRNCIVSTQEMITGGDGQPGNLPVAQLVARRWQEERRHAAFHATNRGAGLHASWLRHCQYGDLMLLWFSQTTRDL